MSSKYVIKCDSCCKQIGETDSLSVSCAGGLCPECRLVMAAQILLHRIDNITTADFGLGGERKEREALRDALKAYEILSKGW